MASLMDGGGMAYMRTNRVMVSAASCARFLSVEGAEPATEVRKPPGRMVDIGGRRLHLNCPGDGSASGEGENGGGSFSVDWALVQPTVSQFTRICTYDRADYGWSDPGPIRDLPEQVIVDLKLLLLLSDVKPPYVLIGQSISGLFVRDFQRHFPQEVAGMVLVDTTHEDGNAYIIDGKPKPISLVTREELQQFMRKYMANPPAQSIPVRVGSPYDRLPEASQTIHLWAAAKLARDRDVRQTPYIGEGQRQETAPLPQQRSRPKHPLGKNPPTVITNRLNPPKAALVDLSEAGQALVPPAS